MDWKRFCRNSLAWALNRVGQHVHHQHLAIPGPLPLLLSPTGWLDRDPLGDDPGQWALLQGPSLEGPLEACLGSSPGEAAISRVLQGGPQQLSLSCQLLSPLPPSCSLCPRWGPGSGRSLDRLLGQLRARLFQTQKEEGDKLG